jgi:hypothetical protein
MRIYLSDSLHVKRARCLKMILLIFYYIRHGAENGRKVIYET